MKEFRIETGLSQSQFARYYGIPISTIQHWEQGVNGYPDYILDMMKRIWFLEKKEDN